MQIEIKITGDGLNKTFSLDTDSTKDIIATVKKYHLDLLGSWSMTNGEAVFDPYDEEISAKGLKILSYLLANEGGGGVPVEDFTGKVLRWAKFVQHYDFSKIPPFNLSLICGAVLTIWERVKMSVSSEGVIVLGGEPDYCPLYAPARKLWKIVKKGTAAAPTLAACIDQKGDLLYRMPGSKDNEFIHLKPISKRCVCVTLPDGTKKTFTSYREALDFIEIYPAYGLSGKPKSKGYIVRPVPPKGADNIEVILPDGMRRFFMTYSDAQDFAKAYTQEERWTKKSKS